MDVNRRGITMEATVFYSWQSDLQNGTNRSLIQGCLEKAAKELRADDSIKVEPVIDRDTQDVPGSPDITGTILGKIDSASVVVADVSIINCDGEGRPTPNPNVLLEVGYTAKSLGWERLILVHNSAFGGVEDLPFDLRPKRALRYNCPIDLEDRSQVRRELHGKLKSALALVLGSVEEESEHECPVEITVSDRKTDGDSHRHNYRLTVQLKNSSPELIDTWHVDVEFPRPLLNSDSQFLRVASRSTNETVHLRSTQDTHPGAIYPGDPKTVMTIDYHMDDRLYDGPPILLQEVVRINAYVSGHTLTVEKTVEDITNF